MWDVILTASSVIFIASLLPTLLDSRTYIPRTTSGPSIFGLTLVVIGLTGAGLYLSAAFTVVAVTLWVFIFVFRGTPATD